MSDTAKDPGAEAAGLTIEQLTEHLRGARSDDEVDAVLWADTLLGRPVSQFPARGPRPADPLRRAAELRLLRRTIGDLVCRPDLGFDGRAWLLEPGDGGSDVDLIYDVLIEQGDLDFEDRPAVALCRFGLHRNFGLGVDSDAIYIAQRVLVAVDVGDDAPDVRLLAATLTPPIHGRDVELPSSDVRDDLESLRQRVWREHAWRALAVIVEE